MTTYAYAIIGGGMTAAAAIDGIRSRDPQGGRIGLFSADRYPPYSRPPLSKGLWKEDRLEDIWRYASAVNLGVEEHLNTEVVALDPKQKTLTDQSGRVYGYEKLLLATGGSPVTLPFANDATIYFRTLDDYLTIWRAAREHAQFLIIGGGFIGAEMAAALAMQGQTVRMVFPEAGLLARVLPPNLSTAVTDLFRSRGVEIITSELVQDLRSTDRGYRAHTASGLSLDGDLVIAGIGIRPNTALAASADLLVDGGIVVDDYGCTTDPHIYAAGDVARIPAPALNRTLRVEHEDNAVARGRLAGINMAGGHEATPDLPYFYSDLFDLGFEAVGMLDPTLSIVADWVEPFREGVLYYLDDSKVVGVLNWNVWDGLPTAQKLIAHHEPIVDVQQLIGLIRNP